METLVQLVFILSMLVLLVVVTGLLSYWVNQKREKKYAALKKSLLKYYSVFQTDTLELLDNYYSGVYMFRTPNKKMKIRIEAIEEVLDSRQ